MRKINTIVVLLSLVLGLFSCLSAAHARPVRAQPHAASHATGLKPGLVLQQRLMDWGLQNVKIRQDAIRIDDPVRGYTLVSKAPDWLVTVANPQKKMVHIGSIASLEKGFSRRMGMFSSSNINAAEWKNIGPHTVDGFPTIAFEEPLKLGETRRAWVCCMSAKWKVAPQVSQILSAYYDIPDLNGLPISILRGNLSKTPKIKTLSASETLLNDADFVLSTKGLKSVGLEEVLFAEMAF